MKIAILGGGWYGCHIASTLLAAGHEVELRERGHRLFSGASGANPARLHIGPHYPRSHATRKACRENHQRFRDSYGALTKRIARNLYAVAAQDSFVDFGNYLQVLQAEIPLVPIDAEKARFAYGIRNIEGAIVCDERHILVDDARRYFTTKLQRHTVFQASDNPRRGTHDWTVDCTFCGNGEAAAYGVDRYEPCVTWLVEGPTDTAITIMDGPFPSIYPWDERARLSSLTSAKFTPLAKCSSYADAVKVLDEQTDWTLRKRWAEMVKQLEYFYPGIEEYGPAEPRLSVRAMPRSGADARLTEVRKAGDRVLTVRAGKIDAIFVAADQVLELINAGGPRAPRGPADPLDCEHGVRLGKGCCA